MDLKKLSFPRLLSLSLLFLLLTSLQCSVLSRSGIFGIVPDLILSAVIAVGFYEGPLSGGVCGLLAGILIEAAGGSGICLYPLLYMLAGYICGALFVSSIRRNLLTKEICVSVALTARSAVSLFKAMANVADLNVGHYILRTALPEIIISSLLALLIFPVVGLIHSLTHQTEK